MATNLKIIQARKLFKEKCSLLTGAHHLRHSYDLLNLINTNFPLYIANLHIYELQRTF